MKNLGWLGWAIAIGLGIYLVSKSIQAPKKLGWYSGYMRIPDGQIFKVSEANREAAWAAGLVELAPVEVGQLWSEGKITEQTPEWVPSK